MKPFQKRDLVSIAILLATLVSVGCQSAPSRIFGPLPSPPAASDTVAEPSSDSRHRELAAVQRAALLNRPIVAPVPKELNKICLPDYRVEPPDILSIEAVRAIPKPPYKAEPLDVLFVSLANPLPPPNEPLTGQVSIDTDGTINLGVTYGGSIAVVGKTLAEIRAAIEKHLATNVGLKDPHITVSLSQGRAAQKISGPHLVRQDGTVSLGTYGSVQVTGMTLAQVRKAIESHLSEYLLNPEIAVDVLAYNSQIYYVVLDGGGAGQTVMRLPITGNETVLDAISNAKGLSAVSSKDRIWVSRPAPEGAGHQVLPVNWKSVVELGDTTTNFQILPGDRVYVAAYPLTALDVAMARFISPFERLFGITLLGTSVHTAIKFPNGGNSGGGVP
jgi:polysaccharide biosynthesis/export protein